MKQESISLKIPADKFFLGLVRKLVVDFSEKIGIDDYEKSKIEMSVDEACANIINHAYKKEDTNLINEIEIEVSAEDQKMKIEILDKGEPFDFNDRINNLTNLKDHAEKMNENGLGLYVINNFVDEVSFERTEDGYNKLSMTKLLKTSSVTLDT